ncbi:MAG: class I SAM-dependent methyltransferase, partial [Candidatus Poribacteria bacterium]|nr:class I SAM-dependent methyltransferase [Candidatus Poribacteria bacterium]
RQREVWAQGDYRRIGTGLLYVSELLAETMSVRPGSAVLDVACGTGNTSLAMARRDADVTGLDFQPALIEHARQRVKLEGFGIEFHEGDAQALPFEDDSFDAVSSVFGVMFPPDQQKTANEIVRVCRRGGMIGLASWSPEGYFVDIMGGVMAKYAPPPPEGVHPPFRWGTDKGIAELFGGSVSEIRSTRREHLFRSRSEHEMVEHFIKFAGPMVDVYRRLSASDQRSFEEEYAKVVRKHNRANDGTCVFPSPYLETILVV